ncbi:MAG: hypothetical protein DYG88_04820 [Chloroflexi bacterium CFX4]|nr:hypothetical protein [Chloroflexi bacterium CFX4]MDL1924100.1 hypothetical protein [Chloroflexi bacterium CFX3]
MADVAMDYEVVARMAKVFGTSGDVLKTVGTVLEIAAKALKASAMFGMVGNLALAFYLDNIATKCKTLSATCIEMDGDLNGAIKALRDSDFSGSTRFV